MAQTVAELLISMGVTVEGADKAVKSLDEVEKSAEDVEKDGGSALVKFSKVAGQALAATAVAVTAAAVAIAAAGKVVFDFVAETTHAIDQMGEEAEKTGLGAEQYQRLAYAADKSGTSIETVVKASRKLNAGLAEAAAGGKKFEEDLNAIGLTASDLAGLDLTSQLGRIGDALNLYSDDASKSALAATLLGKEAGPELALLLKDGTEGILALKDAAGEVFTEEDIASAQALTDQLEEFDKIIGKAAGDLAVALAPHIEEIVVKVTEWIAENDDFIKQDLPKLITDIASALGSLIPWLVDVVEGFRGFGKEIRDLIYTLETEFPTAIAAIGVYFDVLLAPINAVIYAITTVVDKITDLIRASETLSNFARDTLGIDLSDEVGTTSVRGAAASSRETEEERQTRIAQTKQEEHRAWVDAQSDALVPKLREEAQKKAFAAWSSKTIIGAKGRKFTKIEREGLMEIGKSEGEIDRIEEGNLRRKNKGGGGKAKKEKEKEKEFHLTSLEQAIRSTTPGVDIKKLGLSITKLKPSEVKPESIINITNNNFQIKQDIRGEADPVAIGNAAIAAAKKEINITLARAAQSSQTNVVR